MHTCNASILELEAGGLCVLGQSLLYNETLCQKPNQTMDYYPYHLFVHLTCCQAFAGTLTSQRTEYDEDFPVWKFFNDVII